MNELDIVLCSTPFALYDAAAYNCSVRALLSGHKADTREMEACGCIINSDY